MIALLLECARELTAVLDRHAPNLPAEGKGKIGPYKQTALCWQNRCVAKEN